MNKYKIITMFGNECCVHADNIPQACRVFERNNHADIHSVFTVLIGVDE